MARKKGSAAAIEVGSAAPSPQTANLEELGLGTGVDGDEGEAHEPVDEGQDVPEGDLTDAAEGAEGAAEGAEGTAPKAKKGKKAKAKDTQENRTSGFTFKTTFQLTDKAITAEGKLVRRNQTFGWFTMNFIRQQPGISYYDLLKKGGRAVDLRWDMARGNIQAFKEDGTEIVIQQVERKERMPKGEGEEGNAGKTGKPKAPGKLTKRELQAIYIREQAAKAEALADGLIGAEDVPEDVIAEAA